MTTYLPTHVGKKSKWVNNSFTMKDLTFSRLDFIGLSSGLTLSNESKKARVVLMFMLGKADMQAIYKPSSLFAIFATCC